MTTEFDESVGSTKAYFINKVLQKYPKLDKKDIESWFKSQEVVQVNTKVKGINLKITAKPRTFQIKCNPLQDRTNPKTILIASGYHEPQDFLLFHTRREEHDQDHYHIQ
jgi:hypothetical protein